MGESKMGATFSPYTVICCVSQALFGSQIIGSIDLFCNDNMKMFRFQRNSSEVVLLNLKGNMRVIDSNMRNKKRAVIKKTLTSRNWRLE